MTEAISAVPGSARIISCVFVSVCLSVCLSLVATSIWIAGRGGTDRGGPKGCTAKSKGTRVLQECHEGVTRVVTKMLQGFYRAVVL
jgi:hypothetical protein